MANDLSFSLLKFVVRGLFDRRPCLLTMCLGLCFFRAAHCCNVRRISPRRPKLRRNLPLPRPQSVSSLRRASRTAKKNPAVPAKLPQTGEASWYGAQHQGKQTASGTIYDQAGLTAAHPSLPFGSKIKVTNLANGKSVEVEITDRGPAAGNRIIDLSQAAAKALEMIESGTATVRLELPSGQ